MSGTVSHCSNRLFEWAMAAALFGMGVFILIWPESMGASAFRLVLNIISPETLTALYLGVGFLRLLALYANGHLPFAAGPHVRAVGCLIGGAIWLQMDIALIGLMGTQGTPPSPGIPMYTVLAIAEIRATYRAAADAKSRIR